MTLADDGYLNYQYEKPENCSSVTTVEPLFWDKPRGWAEACAAREQERAAGLLPSWTLEEARAEVARRGVSNQGAGKASEEEEEEEEGRELGDEEEWGDGEEVQGGTKS